LSLSSIVSDVKHVLVDLPTIRTAVVAGLGAAGSIIAVLPHVGVDTAAVSGVVTALVAFLASPKFVTIVNDIASAAAPESVKKLFRKR
jgi:hypothetical protein